CRNYWRDNAMDAFGDNSTQLVQFRGGARPAPRMPSMGRSFKPPQAPRFNMRSPSVGSSRPNYSRPNVGVQRSRPGFQTARPQMGAYPFGGPAQQRRRSRTPAFGRPNPQASRRPFGNNPAAGSQRR